MIATTAAMTTAMTGPAMIAAAMAVIGGAYGGNPRQAVEQCVRAAERYASRASYGRADVTDVRDIDRKPVTAIEVKGRIAVNTAGP